MKMFYHRQSRYQVFPAVIVNFGMLVAAIIVGACASTVPAAHFEGSVYYRTEAKIGADHPMRRDSANFAAFRRYIDSLTASDRQVFHFAAGNFKIERLGTVSEELFDFGGQQVLLLEPDDKYYRPRDYTQSTDSVVAARHLDEEREVLGRRCQGFEVEFYDPRYMDSTTFRIFYDAQLKVDPRPFTSVKRDHWNIIFGETAAVPLVMEIRKYGSEDMTMVFEAVRLDARPPADSVFLPRDGIPVGPRK